MIKFAGYAFVLFMLCCDLIGAKTQPKCDGWLAESLLLNGMSVNDHYHGTKNSIRVRTPNKSSYCRYIGGIDFRHSNSQTQTQTSITAFAEMNMVTELNTVL